MHSMRSRSGKFTSGSKLLKSERASKLFEKRQEFVKLSTQDHDYCDRFNLETPESVFSDSLSNFDFEEEVTETVSDNERDFEFECMLHELPTDLVDLDYCRFVVELGFVAKQLNECDTCSKPLHLTNSLGVKPAGVTGILYVQCPDCGSVNKVYLGKTHYPTGNVKGRGVFDINAKVATGMVHAGMGETQLNNLFSTMNVHCIHHKTLKERENQIGKIIEETASTSEEKYLQEEILQSLSSDAGKAEKQDSEQNFTEQTGIRVSTDTCWQKKGSGKAYNSLSGVATLIGEKTGKVLGHKLRCVECRICDSAAKQGNVPRDHNCKKNWIGSAKGMEPDMFVDLVRDLSDRDVNISTITGDDDTTGYNRAKATISKVAAMEKLSDRNHVRKNIVKHLYELRSKHKELSIKVINAIAKNFSYMLSQNKGNVCGIENGLRALVGHLFGDHDCCSSSWCGYKKGKSYHHSNLPYGKDLTSGDLKRDLEKLFLGNLMNQAKKLAYLSSSQANESLNNVIASKAPKAKHYSSSASLSYRVGSAVLEKNEGYSYVSRINRSAGLSPGNETLKRAKVLDSRLQRKRTTASSRKGKKQRLQRKLTRATKTSGAEIREGRTYVPNIGLDLDDQDPIDEEIPAVTPDVDFSTASKAPYVVFDLETTGLSRSADIIQIAACSKHGSPFHTYVFPNQSMSKEATEITKIQVKGNKMFFQNEEVDYKLPNSALEDFITFLSTFPHKPLLIGHNIKRFDCHVLYNALKARYMWTAFSNQVCGFLDTLDLFKHSHPGFDSYSQQSLVRNLLPEVSFTAHNAIDDTLVLLQLIEERGKLNQEKVAKFIFPCTYPSDFQQDQDNLKTFIDAIQCKAISKAMPTKAAHSNLKLSHLRLAVDRNGFDGLQALFSEPTHYGKPRVSSCSKVTQKMYAFLTHEK